MKKLFTLLVSALGGAMTLGVYTQLQKKMIILTTAPVEVPFIQPVNYTSVASGAPMLIYYSCRKTLYARKRVKNTPWVMGNFWRLILQCMQSRPQIGTGSGVIISMDTSSPTIMLKVHNPLKWPPTTTKHLKPTLWVPTQLQTSPYLKLNLWGTDLYYFWRQWYG